MSVLSLLAHVHFRKKHADLIQYDMAVFSSEDNMYVFKLKAAPLQRCAFYLSSFVSIPPPEARYALANLSSLLIPMHRRAKQTQESFILTITCHVNPPFQSVI